MLLLVSKLIQYAMTYGPQGFWGSGENGYLFSGSTGNYFRGAREQAHNFGDIGSLAKKQKNKEEPPICLIF